MCAALILHSPPVRHGTRNGSETSNLDDLYAKKGKGGQSKSDLEWNEEIETAWGMMVDGTIW